MPEEGAEVVEAIDFVSMRGAPEEQMADDTQPATDDTAERELAEGPLPDYFYSVALKVRSGEFGDRDVLAAYEAAGENPGAVEAVMRRIGNYLKIGRGIFPRSVVEIGSGTGVYLRVAQARWPHASFKVYEIEPFWRAYVRKHKSVVTPVANGLVYSASEDMSADLVHAHGVFVYTKPLESVVNFREMARICSARGAVVFDYLPMDTFDPNTWLASPHRYAQPLAEAFVKKTFDDMGFSLAEKFEKRWQPTPTQYMVFVRR